LLISKKYFKKIIDLVLLVIFLQKNPRNNLTNLTG